MQLLSHILVEIHPVKGIESAKCNRCHTGNCHISRTRKTDILGGFYSFNGMNFYEYMGKKLHFMFGNRTLTYVSTEGEPAIKQLEAEQNEQVKKKGRKAEPETVTADSAVKKQEEFEAMKKKTRNMLLGLVAVIVAAAAGIAAYKAMH